MVLLPGLEARPDQRKVGLGCCNARLRFLLEGVQDVDGIFESDGVDGTAGVAVVVIHDLQHTSAAEALQRLGIGVLVADLVKI